VWFFGVFGSFWGVRGLRLRVGSLGVLGCLGVTVKGLGLGVKRLGLRDWG